MLYQKVRVYGCHCQNYCLVQCCQISRYVCRYYKDIDFQYFSIQRHPMCQNIVARKMLNCSSQWPGYPVQVSGTNLHYSSNSSTKYLRQSQLRQCSVSLRITCPDTTIRCWILLGFSTLTTAYYIYSTMYSLHTYHYTWPFFAYFDFCEKRKWILDFLRKLQ